MKNNITIIAFALAGLTVAGCEGHDRYDHDGRWHRHHDDRRGALNKQVQSQELARNYNMKYESAAKIIHVINSETATQDLANLSIDPQDLAPLAKLNMPSTKSIHNVAEKLGENDELVSLIMSDYIADLKAEANDKLAE